MSAAGPAPAGAALPRPRRFRPKKLIKGLVVMVIGMVIGSALTAHYGHRMMMRFLGDPDKMSDRLHRRLDRQLDLTPEQSAKVGAIISDRTHRFFNILRETRPRLEENFEAMHQEIRRELDPKQAEEWDRIQERMKKHMPPPFGPLPENQPQPQP